SATTLHDEFDRPTEVEVRNAAGDLVGRTLRTYDTQGNVTEEKQVLDNLAMMVPPEVVGRMLEESGLSADQLQSELRTQLSKVIRHPSEPKRGFLPIRRSWPRQPYASPNLKLGR